MKKILGFAFLALVILAGALAIYRFSFRKSIPEAPADQQVLAILKQNDCFVCHSSEPELPFYKSFPVIGSQMLQHVTYATRFTDLDAQDWTSQKVSEVALSMLEHSVEEENMPIVEYKMVHWGTGFNRQEKSLLLKWIKEVRSERFSTGLASAEFANEPIQPLPYSIPTDPAKVDLGKRMYYDGRISLDGTISCATCHILEKGGADDSDERVSVGINGNRGGVNAPTVYNAYYNVLQFWNGRAADLKEQAAGPPVNPAEMGDQTWDMIVARLQQDKDLVKEFEALYPSEGLTQSSVTDAIAEFEKTLLTPDSRFDLYLKGDENAISDDQEDGYEEFKEYGCATCHVGKIIGGQSFELVNVYGDYYADRTSDIAYSADDEGLKGFTNNEADKFRFKVPSLRNVALTAPYYHDGSVKTLEDAVRTMMRYQLNIDNPKLEDVNEIVDFLQTLTGKNAYLTQK